MGAQKYALKNKEENKKDWASLCSAQKNILYS